MHRNISAPGNLLPHRYSEGSQAFLFKHVGENFPLCLFPTSSMK